MARMLLRPMTCADLGWLPRLPDNTPLCPPDDTGLRPREPRTAELGYRLLPDVWGMGYATEGARALIRSAFADLGVEQVVATTMTVNARDLVYAATCASWRG